MVRPARLGEASEIIYDGRRWRIFKHLRKKALCVVEAISGIGPEPLVHGSVARGDVDADSDVDVFIPGEVHSYKLELALRGSNFNIWKRDIVMATPWQLPKAQIYLDEKTSVTFPLTKPRQLELDFYSFGGAVGSEELELEKRVPGVDKRLMLIEPTPKGHVESSMLGREAEVAKLLGVGIEIVRERVQVLKRRAEVGHTGIFLQRTLGPDESFEAAFKKISEQKPDVKLRLKWKN